MTVKRFEELYCWQEGRELVKLVYSMTRQAKFGDFSLKDQIQRAAVSVARSLFIFCMWPKAVAGR